MTHPNAPLTPEGRRRLAKLIVDEGWTVRLAAERFQCSPATASRWATRYRAGEPLADRSSRPHHSPARLCRRTERRIVALRVARQWGPHRIGYHLGLAHSTVGRVLGRVIGNRHNKKRGRGYAYLHHAVDDHSRLAYSEILSDERGRTAARFWTRARAWFARRGIRVQAVLTDNGACYRSRSFARALGKQVKHRRTRPYRPQTNGKVERFDRTLLAEWAYAETYTSEEARAATYAAWLHHYNQHRPHTGIGGAVPADRVHNLPGKYN